MTTKNSPLSALKAQAGQIASLLKAAERGDKLPARYAESIAAARARGSFKFAVAMDDKTIVVEIPWATIRETTEPALVEYILNLMLERVADQ